MSFDERFDQTVHAHLEAVNALDSIRAEILQAATLLSDCLGKGKKVLFCGNGGSAADAQHLAAELVGRFQAERRALPALALHTDTSAMTSIANDYGYSQVFARQVEAHGRPGDVLVAISTSGNSENILAAARSAAEHGLSVVGMTGADGGKLKSLCQVWIGAPATVTPRVQECHILIGHFLCECAEAQFLS